MIRALMSGFAGACTLALAHQLVKQSLLEAPALDKPGMEGLRKLLGAVGVTLTREQLFKNSLAADILLNTLYFAQVGDKRGVGALVKGISLGVAMGSGAVALPDAIGLDGEATHKTVATAATTIALYGLGGLTAAMVAQIIGKSK